MLFCVDPILRLCIGWLLQPELHSHWNAEGLCILSLKGTVVTSIICHAGYFSSRYTVSPWWTPCWHSRWQEQALGVSSPSPAEEIHFGIHALICVVWLQQLLWLFWWMKKVLWWSTFECTCPHPKRGDLCVFLLFHFIWERSAEPPQNKSRPAESGFVLVENCTRSNLLKCLHIIGHHDVLCKWVYTQKEFFFSS